VEKDSMLMEEYVNLAHQCVKVAQIVMFVLNVLNLGVFSITNVFLDALLDSEK
jgi:hypothetical protein